jgi:hypothetical protein
MTKLFHSYTRYTDDKIGSVHDVLICESASDGTHFVGHNKSYEHILVPAYGDESLLGKRVRVKITEVSKFHMKSVIVSEPILQAPTEVEKQKGAIKVADFYFACVLSAVLLLAYFIFKFFFVLYFVQA